MKEFIKFLLDIKAAYSLWRNWQDDIQKESDLQCELIKFGLPGDAAYNLGTALIMADELGIKLYKGMTFNDCRAVLSRDKFTTYFLKAPDELFSAGQFVEKPFKEVIDIVAINSNVCFAIARCALLAKESGVI